jgi:hypothetical protein
MKHEDFSSEIILGKGPFLVRVILRIPAIWSKKEYEFVKGANDL